MLKGKRILVVDDSPTIRRLLRNLLTKNAADMAR
jgi:CheY-like chemotaxis protein